MTVLHKFHEITPFGGYRMIMADPPWSQTAWGKDGYEKAPQAHYACMTLDDIAALPVEALAGKDCFLWLWALNNMLPQALDVMKAWGFTFKTSGHWAKYNRDTGAQAFGTGYILRGAGEPFIIGTKGTPPVRDRSVRSVFLAPRRKHSQKPDQAYAAAQALAGRNQPCIELFSRTERPGWATWGNETGTITLENAND